MASTKDAHSELDSWYLENLVCPIDHTRLEYRDGNLVSTAGRQYPVINGVPIMLAPNVEQTHWVAHASLEWAKKNQPVTKTSNYYIETLGISDYERLGIADLILKDQSGIDPVVAFVVAQTNGIAYKHLIGNLKTYPIPDLRLPNGHQKTFLDLGCNWGRWCVAAARKGYVAVGLDPSMGAIMAAHRVAKQLALPIKYIVADSRYLPFNDKSMDVVFSYSVLQHLSKANVGTALSEAGRVLRIGGTTFIQMPNLLGIRSLHHQIKRWFRMPKAFEVRYWSLGELKRTFNNRVGPTVISVDCFFGLGLQKSDIHLMPFGMQLIIRLSEILRKLSHKIPALTFVADSVYIRSTKDGVERSKEKPIQ
ncbi:methyltransferase domain-containing protein [Candidatus Nitrospira salsa]